MEVSGSDDLSCRTGNLQCLAPCFCWELDGLKGSVGLVVAVECLSHPVQMEFSQWVQAWRILWGSLTVVSRLGAQSPGLNWPSVGSNFQCLLEYL
ncbi:hypothetical protein TNIN_274371 [Trichonephila inaurata madagascariensis]|uniref:Uncharacterized protein n=1 Tax=Trichonephila inaurata madagascariensis TaxID=2747483 RepID=A0A8X6X5G0_9ARAC|nr:hypothetical protein TNIN_274371 [Trichonephila inaurata madagascariensis]